MAREHHWFKDEESGRYVHNVSVTTNAPVDTCFLYWSDFENFPNLMSHIDRVTRTNGNTWHWEATVAGVHAEWNAEMTEYRENEIIAWTSIDGLRNMGSVRFIPDGDGCVIAVHLEYDPPYGFIGDIVAERRVSDAFHDDLQHDLLRFKEAVESGMTEHFRRRAA